MPAGLEIERKFLVTTAPEGLDTYSSKDIDQGYLAVTDDGGAGSEVARSERGEANVTPEGGIRGEDDLKASVESIPLLGDLGPYTAANALFALE